MEFAFPWPYTEGEWLAWTSALATVLYGLIAFFAPRLRLRALRLGETVNHPEIRAESRAQLGGFYVGIGAAAILFAQPLVYMALGVGWGLAVVGRLLSLIFDRALTPRNCMHLLICAVLSALPLIYVFGIIP